MNPAAIIAEYNPFHKGHELHIRRTREMGATHIAVIMSGNFTQRGEAAIADKWTRAEMALRGGADLIIELPVEWSVRSAQYFARGGVFLAESLGCVNMLSFGSERGDVSALRTAADAVDYVNRDNRAGRRLLDMYLRRGMGYAAAMQAACAKLCSEETAAVFSGPNDTLGVEYIRELRRQGSGITPLCVKREGAAHDGRPESGVASASYIRDGLNRRGGVIPPDDDGTLTGGTTPPLQIPSHFLPRESARLLQKAIGEGRAPASLARAERAVLAQLRRMSAEDFAKIDGGLAQRLSAAVSQGRSVGEIISLTAAKNHTTSRVRRLILASFLGGFESPVPDPCYIRVLGMNSRGRELLSAIKNNAPSLPIVTKYAEARRLGGDVERHYLHVCRTTDLYGLTLPEIPPGEWEKRMPLVNAELAATAPVTLESAPAVEKLSEQDNDRDDDQNVAGDGFTTQKSSEH